MHVGYLFHVKCTDSFSSTSTQYPQHLHPTHTCLAHRSSHTSQHLQRLYAQAAISGATNHSGRRTWLTELSSKGVGVRVVLAEMAGHASIQTTQRYIDVNDEQMRSAAELI